jgi:hypothetical protein
MFSGELISLLKQVVTSWQVIAVSVVLVIYMLLVSYVTRSYKRPGRTAAMGKSRKNAPAPVGEPDVETTKGDDLGLVEE